MPDLGQKRAAHAWTCVQKDCSSDYTNLAKSAPALIMNNGLMQTLAFYQGKGKAQHLALLSHVTTWLQGRFSGIGNPNFEATMRFLHSADSAVYRRATDETLELLRWIRQFAPALKGGQGEED